MSRPGGNPDIADYGFEQKHSWSERCTKVKNSEDATIDGAGVERWTFTRLARDLPPSDRLSPSG